MCCKAEDILHLVLCSAPQTFNLIFSFFWHKVSSL